MSGGELKAGQPASIFLPWGGLSPWGGSQPLGKDEEQKDVPFWDPWFFGASAMAKADSWGQGWGHRAEAGTNRAPVCFFSSAAAASRPGAVFSVEGAPENRAGKSSVAAHLPVPS